MGCRQAAKAPAFGAGIRRFKSCHPRFIKMEKIKVEKKDKEDLEKKGVFTWSIWEKEVSSFDWYYDNTEVCYLLSGKVVVTPEGGDPVEFKAGDLVTFPKGMKCVWDIKEDVRKHYIFK